jgi:hypothetical protein
LWCQNNDLSLNVGKTKELIMAYRKRKPKKALIKTDRAEVESFKFLGVHITNEISWSKHLKNSCEGKGPQILKNFNSCTIESILRGCITTLYGNCSESDLRRYRG